MADVQWLTPKEAAKRLALSERMIFLLLRDGEIRSVKVGAARRIPIQALVEYEDRLLSATS